MSEVGPESDGEEFTTEDAARRARRRWEQDAVGEILRRPQDKREEMENLRVVLVATRNPLNIGAVARAMSNFGARHLRVVHPYEKAFREARSAVGATEVLREAEECSSVAEAVADCGLVVGTTAIGNREIKHPLRSLDRAGPVLRKRLAKERVALLFGSEKWGLSNESLSYCHWVVHIPTREEHQSMNLGQAAAVCLYELARGKKSFEEGTKRVGARMETVERITEALLDCLLRSGYVAARSKELAEEKLRRMLRRFSLDAGDAEVFLGMMRKVEEELKRSGPSTALRASPSELRTSERREKR